MWLDDVQKAMAGWCWVGGGIRGRDGERERGRGWKEGVESDGQTFFCQLTPADQQRSLKQVRVAAAWKDVLGLYVAEELFF